MKVMILNIDYDTKMADLIINNQQILYMLDRFNIPLGFKDATIEELATTNNVDKDALLAITQLIINEESHAEICTRNSLKDLLRFLDNSHQSFRDKIASLKLIIDKFSEDISGKYEIILKSFYNEYIEDIKKHFLFEEENVFPYIKTFFCDECQVENSCVKNISDFEGNHSDTELKLKDLKNILIKYLPASIKSRYRNKILYCLYDLEPDMNLHAEVENKIIIPLVKHLEKGESC